MRRVRRHFAAIALCLSAPATAAPVAAPVAVTGGLIEGEVSSDQRALIFRGIPFAAPPTGGMRWRQPAAVIPWTGVRAARQPSPACLQNDYGWNRANHDFSSEDCLTLDVRAPVARNRPLPVMVWIHGGSNRAGGAAGTVESRITDEGVVLVAIQYRLGIFGFLSRKDLATEQKGRSGNYGLLDQIAALKWVHSNIARFGGDPGNVTIFGESAGSQDVSLLLASPIAKGLFHKAIMQSGTPGFGMKSRSLTDAFGVGAQLDDIIGSMGALDGLRETPAADLLAADLKLMDPDIWRQDFLWLRPTLDGLVLPDSPEKLLARAPHRPVIIGTNRFEFGPAKGSIDADAYARHWFGDNAIKAMTLYRKEERNPDPRLGHLEGRMETDVVFRCPSGHLAQLLSSNGWPVWRYEFDVGPDNGTPAGGLTSHAYEIGFILDRRPLSQERAPVQLQDVWVHFARTGRPGNIDQKPWPAFRPGRRNYVVLDRKGAKLARNLREDLCRQTRAI